jgi:hypothetical protein
MSSIFCVKNSLKINLSCRFVVEMLDRRVEIEKLDYRKKESGLIYFGAA